MRELGIECSYDAGADPLMDLCRREPSLRGRSIATGVSRDQCWLVERFLGPEAALAEVEAIRCGDGDGAPCGTVRDATVLERSPASVVTYLYLDRLHTCDSVYAIAARRLDRGFIVHGRRHGGSRELRILTRSEATVEAFYERLRASLPEDVSLEFGHLNGVSQWEFDSLASVTLPPEQRETLRAAIEQGYYETPRGITVAELADHLDTPQSTVSYRLRQAEARLARGYFGIEGADGEEPRPAR
jgi:predicted DNA binding protein